MLDRLGFEWDDKKAAQNLKKHGVSFKEAQTVFYDEAALDADDPDHSEEEDRCLMFGISSHARPLVVVYSLRNESRTIRIISARKLTKEEKSKFRKRYRK